MHTTIDGLREALRNLESEIPGGTNKARQSLHQVHLSLKALTGQAHV